MPLQLDEVRDFGAKRVGWTGWPATAARRDHDGADLRQPASAAAN
jgi:hypothetical protein